MKEWKVGKIILFVSLCVCMNVFGRLLSVSIGLPLWTDSFGTAMCSCVAGPVCGAIVGVTGNLAYGVVNHISAAYSVTSVALAFIIGRAAKKHWFDHFYGFMVAFFSYAHGTDRFCARQSHFFKRIYR